MELTERIARYILSLQSIAELEIESYAEDIAITKLLEQAFPILKEERVEEEFRKWVRYSEIEKNSGIKKLRKKLQYSDTGTLSYYTNEPIIKQLDELREDVEKKILSQRDTYFKKFKAEQAIKKLKTSKGVK